MRPFLPQSKVNFPVLFKLLVIYGVVALIVLLCVVVVEFVIHRFDYYWRDYTIFGKSTLLDNFDRDFVGMDSNFMRSIRKNPLLTLLAPLGAGGIIGVIHYIFVRRRKSIYNIQESSKSNE
jgi:hypothetical protein